LRVLLPPARLEDLDEITPGVLVDVLDGLRAEFDWVIVDTWHTVEPATLAIMEAADLVLLITTPELPALDSVRRFLDSLIEFPSIPGKLRLLVNRHPSLGGVELDYVGRRLDLVPFVTFPSAGVVMTHLVNEGGAGGGAKANPFTRQLQELVSLLTGAPAPDGRAPGRRGLFARRT
jgi:Flp pilus assembly CpaE family ATPase